MKLQGIIEYLTEIGVTLDDKEPADQSETVVEEASATEDETVEQTTTTANGTVYQSNNTHTSLTTVRGTFGASNSYIVTGDTSSETVRFKNSIPPDLVRGSGEVLLLKNVEAVSRSNTLTETVKLVLKF